MKRLRSIKQIQELTGLEPQLVLKEAFHPAHFNSDRKWTRKRLNLWGTGTLTLLARIFEYATVQELNSWLEVRIDERRRDKWREQSTMVTRKYLLVFLQEWRKKAQQ